MKFEDTVKASGRGLEAGLGLAYYCTSRLSQCRPAERKEGK